MRRVFITEVDPGMRLGSSIRGSRGELLLASGVRLTEAHLRLLAARGCLIIHGEDGLTEDIEIPEFLPHQVRSAGLKAMRDLNEFLEKAARVQSAGLNGPETLERGVLGKSPGKTKVADAVFSAAGAVVDAVLDRDLSFGLGSIQRYDEYTFEHSIGVAVAGVLIGRQVGMNHDQLCVLATGCLLHDLGKVFVDLDVLHKPGKLTDEEMEVMRLHTQLGYTAAKQLFGPGVLSNHVPFQHHERQDARGYPRGLKGANVLPGPGLRHSEGDILPYAEIASVADVYDALSTDRPYRAALPVEQVRHVLQGMAGTVLNQAILDKFLGILVPFPTGTEVIVHAPGLEGFGAVVVKQNLGQQTRPVARVLWDPSGQPIAPLEIDLAASAEAELSLPLPPWPGGTTPAPRDWGTIRAAAAVEAVSAMVC